MKAKPGAGNREPEAWSQPVPKEVLPSAIEVRRGITPALPTTDYRLPTSIELHIEELVIHGFEPNDCEQLASAVESELARLLTERGIQQSLTDGIEIERLHGGAFRIKQDEPSTSVGQHLAGAIYSGINGGKRG